MSDPTPETPEAEAPPASRKVTFVHHHGRHVPGDVVDLPAREAERLVRAKRAAFSGDKPARKRTTKR